VIQKPKQDFRAAGAAISVDACWQDFGKVHGTDTAEYSVKITNIGTLPLNLKVLETSCGCTTASLQAHALAANDTTSLIVAVSLKDKRGYYQESVVLETNDTRLSQLRLFLAGTVLKEVRTSENSIALGELLLGQTIVRKILLEDPGIGDLRLASLKVEAADGDSTPDVVLSAESIRIDTDTKVRLDNRVAQCRRGDHIISVKVLVPPTALCGKISRRLRILANLPSGPIDLSVNVTGNVQPYSLDVCPRAILKRIDSRSGWRETITLKRGDSAPLVITNIRFTGGLPLTVACTEKSIAVSHLTIDFEPTQTTDGHSFSGKIVCELADLPEIEIPVLLFSRDVP
jgi:hypothetical protein